MALPIKIYTLLVLVLFLIDLSFGQISAVDSSSPIIAGGNKGVFPQVRNAAMKKPPYYQDIPISIFAGARKSKTEDAMIPRDQGQSAAIEEFPMVQDGAIHGSHFPGAFSQEVLLFRLSANGLPSKDFWGNGHPDPFVQISYANGSSPDRFERFSRTETLLDTPEPEWQDVIKFENYIRQTGQKWRFEVRDHDVGDFDDHIGYAQVEVDDCVQEARQRQYRGSSACSAQISGGNGILYVELL